MRGSAIALCLALLTTPAGAAEFFADYAQKSVRVLDGDSFVIASERIRLRSEAGPIDAPELRSAKCPLELFRAQAAKERLAQIMAPNDFSIDRRGYDRYGRTVAIVYSEGVDVGALLVAEGHARPWRSLRKKDRPTWCGGSITSASASRKPTS